MDFLIRSEMLLGKDKIERLAHSSIAIFGLGGVGGGAVEALARAGVGEFHLIDADRFQLSNLNRQILATRDAIGQNKVDVAKARILSINPEARVYVYPVFFLPGNADEVPFEKFDYVVDAVDTVSAKVELIRRCAEKNIPIVSCMGVGNRLDPSRLYVTDIYQTKEDPLAKVIRSKCREMNVPKLRVVCSSEPPIKPKFKIESDSPSRRDVPGSFSLVPPVAGYYLAHEAILALLKD